MNYKELQNYRVNNLKGIGKCQEYKGIGFWIVIDADGGFKHIESHYRYETKTKKNKAGKITKKQIEVAETIIVPFHANHTSNEAANLLWGKSDYVLGISATKADCTKKLKLFRAKIDALCQDFPKHHRFAAVKKFYDNDGVDQVLASDEFELLKKKPAALITFRLEDEVDAIASDTDLDGYYKAIGIDENTPKGRCIFNPDKEDYLASVFPAMYFGTGVPVSLMPFQENKGCDSYGWVKLENAPIGISTAHDIYNAIMSLYNDKRSCVRMSNNPLRIYLFWTNNTSKDMDSAVKELGQFCFGRMQSEDDTVDDVSRQDEQKKILKDIKKVKEAFKAVWTGLSCSLTDEGKFFIAGFEITKRLIPVLWMEISLKDFTKNIIDHFEDTRISGMKEEDCLGMYAILKSIAPLTNDKPDETKLDTYLIETLSRCIFEGSPYPIQLLTKIIDRIRVQSYKMNDKNGYPVITAAQAGLIRGYLNRKNKNNHKYFTKMLDLKNNSQAYLLGRYLALAERIQYCASKENGGSGKTNVIEKYLAKLSSSPTSIIVPLMTDVSYSVSSLKNKAYWEKEQSQILGAISQTKMPFNLNFEEQGEFALGFWQQKQEYYRLAQEKKLLEQNQGPSGKIGKNQYCEEE